jgi:cobalt-precorrin 5A hydrolase
VRETPTVAKHAVSANEGSVAVLTLSSEGLRTAQRLTQAIQGVSLHVHSSVSEVPEGVSRFDRTAERMQEIFDQCTGLICIMPCGAVVRALAPLITSKLSDPAVVVVDVAGRWAISLLSGHEGGANRLAEQVASAIEAEPIVTTTTEAVRTIIAGIGCRRGVSADEIIAALDAALEEAGCVRSDIRQVASADIKRDEIGLLEAAERLQVGLRFVPSQAIREMGRQFEHSDFVQSKVNLPAVAEPSALFAGSRTCLILQKKIVGRVTVALARERCTWSG